MAGRCNCSSSGAVGAAAAAGDCISVTGAGTPESPFIVTAVVDPDGSNNLQCGPDGLYAAQSQMQAGDCGVVVTGDGSNATPFVVSLDIDADSANLLECGDDGLMVNPTPIVLAEDGCGLILEGDGGADDPWSLALDIDPQELNLLRCDVDGLLVAADPQLVGVGNTILGGSAPATGRLTQTGTTPLTTDANGEATIVMPVAFPNGFISFTHSLSALPVAVIAIETAVDYTTATLQTIKFRAVANAVGDPVVGQLLVSWVAYGW